MLNLAWGDWRFGWDQVGYLVGFREWAGLGI